MYQQYQPYKIKLNIPTPVPVKQLDITTVCYYKSLENKLASISVYGVHLEDALLSVMREVFKETGESRPVFALIQGENK